MKLPSSALAGLVAIGSLVVAPAPALAAESWKYYSVVGSSHELAQGAIAAFGRIEKRTNGQLKIQFVHYGETPHKATEALQLIEDRLVQMSEWIPAYTTGTYPILGAPGLPFLLPELRGTAETAAAADRAWASPAMKAEHSAIVAKHGGRVIGSYYYEPMNFYFAKPVRKIGDFSGRRVRVFSPEQATLMRELGATPVSMTSAEVYSSLQRGLIEGVITSSGGITGLKWHEQLKSVLTSNILMVRTDMLVGESAINRLPKDVRAVLEEEMGAAGRDLRRLITESDHRNHETMKNLGFSFVSSDGKLYQELRKVARDKVWNPWSQSVGPTGEKVLKDIFAAMAEK